MQIEVLTKEDLAEFRTQLLNDLAKYFGEKNNPGKEWLRSNEVKTLLKISNGTLQNLRVKGLLRPSKIEGVYYYKLSEINTLLSEGTTL